MGFSSCKSAPGHTLSQESPPVHWLISTPPPSIKAFLAHGRSFSRSCLVQHVPAATEPSSPAADPMAEWGVQISPSPAFEPHSQLGRPVMLSVLQMTGGVYPRRPAGLVCLPFFLTMPCTLQHTPVWNTEGTTNLSKRGEMSQSAKIKILCEHGCTQVWGS